MVPPDEELARLREAVSENLDADVAYVAYLLAIAQFQEACRMGGDLQDVEVDIADTRYELDFQIRHMHQNPPLATGR